MYIRTGQFDLNLHDNDGDCILHYAAGDVRNMKLVANYKMPFDARGVNTSGKTPMMTTGNNECKAILTEFEAIYDQFLILKAQQAMMTGNQ